jgi:CBS domain-containing protein
MVAIATGDLGGSMNVEALLDHKGAHVATADPRDVVRTALATLVDQRIGALVVTSDGRTVAGIVSERDIVNWLHRAGPQILDGVVGSIMSTDVQTCAPTDDLATLMEVMTARRIRHLPVLRGGVLSGIVSIGDVVKARVDDLELERRVLDDYIHAR